MVRQRRGRHDKNLGGRNRDTFVPGCLQILTRQFASFTYFLLREYFRIQLFVPITPKNACFWPKKAYAGFGKLAIFFWWRPKIWGTLS